MNGMSPDLYMQEALLTESSDFDKIRSRVSDEKLRLLHAAMGLSTESGEFVDMLKKHVFYGKPMDRTNLFEELGDILWYCAIALDVLGEDFESCMRVNNKKLMSRYRSKSFDEDDAVNRDLDTERDLLESR